MFRSGNYHEVTAIGIHAQAMEESTHTDEYRQAYNDGVESFRPKFEEMKARFDQEIAKLSRENEILKNPQCEQCDNFEFGMCQHFRSRDCYLYHRGGTVSLFKIKGEL